MRVPILRLGKVLLSSIQSDLTDEDAICFRTDALKLLNDSDAIGIVIDVSGLDVVDYAVEVVAKGAGEILLTSMDRDGAKIGYDLDLLKAVSGAVGVPVIASGGAGNAQHMVDAVTKGGADAVLAASIFHFGEVAIGEVKHALAAARLPVRLTEAVA